MVCLGSLVGGCAWLSRVLSLGMFRAQLLNERLEVEHAQVIDFLEQFLQFFLLEQDRLDLVLDIVPTDVESAEKLLTLAHEIVVDTQYQVLMGQIVESKLETVATHAVVSHAQIRFKHCCLQVALVVGRVVESTVDDVADLILSKLEFLRRSVVIKRQKRVPH